MKWLFKNALRLAALVITLNVVFGILVAYPNWAFAHSAGTERLQVHATTPLPAGTSAWAEQVMAGLDKTALPPGPGAYHLYVTGGGWREWLYFLPVRAAGGVAYPMNRSAAFLSGADFDADRLIKGTSVIQPPRTLTYYARHEIIHLVQLDRLGLVSYLRLATWKREGIADFIVLGPTTADTRLAIEAAKGSGERLPLMQAHGAYPEFRDAVTRALAGTTITDLLEGDGT